MLCQKCTLFRGELTKAQNNIRLIEYLIEDTGRMEKLQDSLDRLAMLHKHARCGKSDICHYPLRKCVCHCRRAMFRVLGMYNFGVGNTTLYAAADAAA